MSDNAKTLDEVIKEIVFNKDVHNLLLKPNPAHPYGDIMQFQINECIDNGTSIEEEGFQIGEPFDGDIEHAPILFLSSNPAFNFDEVSPRYFPASGKIFMPAHIDTAKKAEFSAGEYSLEKIKKKLTVPQKEMTFEEVKEFFKTRIQTSPARNKNDQTLRIPLKDGGTVAVSYWGCVRNNTEFLLPPALTAKWTALTPSQRAREIMKYAVCMEIVPFRSNGEEGVDNAKNTCWNAVTKHLLALSGASVIVLVGNKVLNCFTSNIDTNAMGTLTGQNIYSCTIGCKQRLVVKVDYSEGAFRRFDTFFNGIMFDSENNVTVIQALQNAVANSSFVQKALHI